MIKKFIRWLDDSPINSGVLIFGGMGIASILCSPALLLKFGLDAPPEIWAHYKSIENYLKIPGALVGLVGCVGLTRWLIHGSVK